ncbi:MAG: hypothetical protein ACLPT6_00225 [Desulfobaccales bacterium]
MNAKKSKPEPDDKEQYARFIEAAKRIDNPDAKKAFEEALSKIIKKRRQTIQSTELKDEP